MFQAEIGRCVLKRPGRTGRTECQGFCVPVAE